MLQISVTAIKRKGLCIFYFRNARFCVWLFDSWVYFMAEPEGFPQISKATITDANNDHFNSPDNFANSLLKIVSLFTRLQPFE
jgi:hypothetical protein